MTVCPSRSAFSSPQVCVRFSMEGSEGQEGCSSRGSARGFTLVGICHKRQAAVNLDRALVCGVHERVPRLAARRPSLPLLPPLAGLLLGLLLLLALLGIGPALAVNDLVA